MTFTLEEYEKVKLGQVPVVVGALLYYVWSTDSARIGWQLREIREKNMEFKTELSGELWKREARNNL